jgi:hypothetical protein
LSICHPAFALGRGQRFLRRNNDLGRRATRIFSFVPVDRADFESGHAGPLIFLADFVSDDCLILVWPENKDHSRRNDTKSWDWETFAKFGGHDAEIPYHNHRRLCVLVSWNACLGAGGRRDQRSVEVYARGAGAASPSRPNGRHQDHGILVVFGAKLGVEALTRTPAADYNSMGRQMRC